MRRPASLLTLLLLILAGAALVLMLRHDAGTIAGLSTENFSRLVALVAVLIFVGVGVFARAMRPGEILHSLAFWFMAIVVLVGLYAFRDELTLVGGRVLGALVPGTPIVGRLAGDDAGDAVVVVRSRGGHFGIRATVNGVAMSLLVDTGASFVTLTESDAARVGIDVEALSFSVRIRTANGTISAASAKVDQIAIGPIERRNVPVLVAPGDTLDQSLLGLSFLDTLAGYTIRGDRLVLNP
jgi:aspartyl protease family protein